MPNPSVLLHQPVLLNEVLSALNLNGAGRYVDATFGRGGHSRAILQRLNAHGRLLALDRDPDALAAHDIDDARFTLLQRPFSQLAHILAERDWLGQVDGMLFDLGVSSPQLEDAQRGFSFSRNGPLDMRMNPQAGISAATWLAQVSAAELTQVLFEFGEERFSRRVAKAIIAAREQNAITSTAQLAAIVAAAIPTREAGKHPATRTFQALRIYINAELTELQAVLPQAVTALAGGGRLAVISFHSLEDRLVKRFMREQARGRELPLDLPVMGEPEGITLRLLGKAQRPQAAEVAHNPRARSAVLRVAERRLSTTPPFRSELVQAS